LVAFDPDCQLMAKALADRTVRVWEVESGREVLRFVLPPRTGPAVQALLWRLEFSPDGNLLVAGDADRIYVWDMSPRKIVSQIELSLPNKHFIPTLAFFSDRRILVSEGRIKLRELPSGREILTVPGFSGDVDSLAVFPGGDRVAAISRTSVLIPQ